MPRTSYNPLLDSPNSIIEAYKLRSSSLCRFFQPPATLSLPLGFRYSLRCSVLKRTQSMLFR